MQNAKGTGGGWMLHPFILAHPFKIGAQSRRIGFAWVLEEALRGNFRTCAHTNGTSNPNAGGSRKIMHTMSPSVSGSARRAPLPPALSSREREQLAASEVEPLHEARNATKARVGLVEWPPQSGERVVVKDGSARASWFRVSIGRYQLAREWKALSFLNGMNGVPRPLFRAGADVFGIERCPGESLLRFASGELPISAVEAFEKLIEELHARGVTHGDLHRDNILFDAATGQIWLIDWATSCVYGLVRRGWKAWLWREWNALDNRAVAKIKARYAPELLRPDEHILLDGGGTPLSRVVRSVGSLFKRRKGREPHVSSSPHASR